MKIRDIIKATFPEYSGEVTTYYKDTIEYRKGFEYRLLDLNNKRSYMIVVDLKKPHGPIPVDCVIVESNGNSVTITGPRPHH